MLLTSKVSFISSSAARLKLNKNITFWSTLHVKLSFSLSFWYIREWSYWSAYRFYLTAFIRKVSSTEFQGMQCIRYLHAYQTLSQSGTPNCKPSRSHHKPQLLLPWKSIFKHIGHPIWNKSYPRVNPLFVIDFHWRNIVRILKLPLTWGWLSLSKVDLLLIKTMIQQHDRIHGKPQSFSLPEIQNLFFQHLRWLFQMKFQSQAFKLLLCCTWLQELQLSCIN